MGIKEIWIPETLAVVFLAAPVAVRFLRPERKMQSRRLSGGFNWLQFVALCVILAIFPAYGFRPECLLLLVFALTVNSVNIIRRVSDIVSRERSLFRREQGPVSAAFVLCLLALAAAPVFVFSPGIPDAEGENVPVAVTGIDNPEFRGGAAGRGYVLCVYGECGESRPVIFLSPPEIGSAVSVDLVCRALYKKGYTVVTYFRDGLDTPLIGKNGKARPASMAKLFSYLRIYKNAGAFAAANERGKELELRRRADVQFLLPAVSSLYFGGNDLPPILFAGYGAGGSALAYLAGDGGLESICANALGAVSIEGRLWSSYRARPRTIAEAPEEENFFRRHWAAFKNWAAGLAVINPQRAERTGPLPDTALPVMYLVSGRALEKGRGEKQYEAVFDAMRSGPGPAALAAVEGAGPLDYQDFPLTYPVFSFLLPGKRGGKRSENPIDETADIIGNFGSFLLEKARENNPAPENGNAGEEGGAGNTGEEDGLAGGKPVNRPEIIVPQHNAVKSGLYFESKGLKGFRL